MIEVLRHTGVRVEEMLELTHRSFVTYTLPTTGEVIPLLQVTPSKTDRERLLVVSPELAEVLSTIISRVRGGAEQLPLVSRYDHAERLHSPPLPFLFQRRWGLRQQVLTNNRVKQLLDRTVVLAGIAGPDGRPLRFTPHDFRRIFATRPSPPGYLSTSRPGSSATRPAPPPRPMSPSMTARSSTITAPSLLGGAPSVPAPSIGSPPTPSGTSS